MNAPPPQGGVFPSPLLGFGFPCPSFLVVALAPSPPLPSSSPSPRHPSFWEVVLSPSSFGWPFLLWTCGALSLPLRGDGGILLILWVVVLFPCHRLFPTLLGGAGSQKKTAPAQRTQGAKHHDPKEGKKGSTTQQKKRGKQPHPKGGEGTPNTPPNTQPTPSFFVFL